MATVIVRLTDLFLCHMRIIPEVSKIYCSQYFCFQQIFYPYFNLLLQNFIKLYDTEKPLLPLKVRTDYATCYITCVL
jgi:hypothetical protein